MQPNKREQLAAHVSIHDYLGHHLRCATLFCWAGSVAGISSIFVWHYQRIRIIPIAIGGVLYIIAYYYHFSARCPRCDTRLLFALASFGVRLRLPASYKTCPSCGLSFDMQRDRTPTPNRAMQRTAGIARIRNVLLGFIVGAIGGALSLGRHSSGGTLVGIIVSAVVCAVAFGVVNPRSRDKTLDSSELSQSPGNPPREDV
jgi:uncharacterized C2H2 Zn-finger protein